MTDLEPTRTYVTKPIDVRIGSRRPAISDSMTNAGATRADGHADSVASRPSANTQHDAAASGSHRGARRSGLPRRPRVFLATRLRAGHEAADPRARSRAAAARRGPRPIRQLWAFARRERFAAHPLAVRASPCRNQINASSTRVEERPSSMKEPNSCDARPRTEVEATVENTLNKRVYLLSG